MNYLDKNYPDQLLRDLQCDFDEKRPSNWPARIVKALTEQKSLHPLFHLLLIQLLGYTAESFFNRCKILPSLKDKGRNYKLPFGKGPWPCLNRASGHYEQKLINECLTKYAPTRNAWKGTFSCRCGFVYTLLSSHTPSRDYILKPVIKQFGPVWEEALCKLWEDKSVSINKTADRLGVGWHRIRAQAMRLGLEFPRVCYGRWAVPVSPIPLKSQRIVETARVKKIKEYRKKWRLGLKTYPNASRWHLKQRILPGVYCWLSKHDNKWLQAHLPPPAKRSRGRHDIDWRERDAILAEEVHRIGKQLKAAAGRPVRITKTAIWRLIQTSPVLQRHSLREMSLSSQAFEDVVETHGEFAIRRAWWVASYIREEHRPVSWSTFLHRACIAYELLSVPDIRSSIDAAWRSSNTLKPDNKNQIAA